MITKIILGDKEFNVSNENEENPLKGTISIPNPRDDFGYNGETGTMDIIHDNQPVTIKFLILENFINK